MALKYDFDHLGPSLGPVRLLVRTALGFQPRSASALQEAFAEAFGVMLDCRALAAKLEPICLALNRDDLAKGAFLTGFLQAHFSIDVDLQKARVDDPDHPGWPQGAPDGKGGQFRPKDDNSIDVDRRHRIERLRARGNFRSVLRRVLTTKRAIRLLGELAGEAIPFVDAAVAPIAVADDIKLLRDMVDDVAQSKAAIEFAERGPEGLEELLVSQEDLKFSSFEAFKKIDFTKYFGTAGDGWQYHHIVEQGPNAEAFTSEELNSTSNIVKIPTLVHEDINAVFNRVRDYGEGEMTLRTFLRGKPFAQQRDWGLWALEQVGAIR